MTIMIEQHETPLQNKSGQSKPDQNNTGQSKSGQSKSGQSKIQNLKHNLILKIDS